MISIRSTRYRFWNKTSSIKVIHLIELQNRTKVHKAYNMKKRLINGQKSSSLTITILHQLYYKLQLDKEVVRLTKQTKPNEKDRNHQLSLRTNHDNKYGTEVTRVKCQVLDFTKINKSRNPSKGPKRQSAWNNQQLHKMTIKS